MKTKTHFAFRVDIWDDTGDSIVEHVAGITDLKLPITKRLSRIVKKTNKPLRHLFRTGACGCHFADESRLVQFSQMPAMPKGALSFLHTAVAHVSQTQSRQQCRRLVVLFRMIGERDGGFATSGEFLCHV
jgi:hypothetical protein